MKYFLLLFSIYAVRLSAAAEPSLVPETPGATPDYFCTWNVQGFACGYANASAQADLMTEASLFGKGPHQNWTAFSPEVRGDLIFLLDDACDYPLGGGHNHPARGSVELDAGRFPSFSGTPAERLAKLNAAVHAKGWRGLGLWICNSRNRLPGQEKIGSDDYWAERLRWSQQAGVLYWKVDWGIGDRGKPLWKFRMMPRIHELAPDIWLEFASGVNADVFRTYDVQLVRSIPETICRIGTFLAKENPKDRRLINCEDEAYLGAALGCHYGIMRHPLTGSMPGGKRDQFFSENFRDVKRRMDEVTRAVRWHRIAQPFPKGGAYLVDTNQLTDAKCAPAPARIARGGLPLPEVLMPTGGEPPYVVCARHPDGEIAIATAGRKLDEYFSQPCVDITLDIGTLERPIGIFGEYDSLTLITTNALAVQKILAQDLAGSTPVDITSEIKLDGGRLTIPGAVLHRVGLMAAKPGDISDPGLVLAVEGLTRFAPKQPMKPDMYQLQIKK
ncbi:MAG: hypothetical protein NTY53_16210 [Kiritimatiellaeota bacterium]|nr:hypothetical protein [Kiritimatiellota bacterium]